MLRIATDALTFDDVLLLPAYSQILPSEVTLSSRVSRNIAVNIPMVSSAMDTVTEARLAIAIAQEGGIGVVHKNMQLELQAKEVRAVKKFESGIIRDPVTITPSASVETLFNLTRDHGISGVPVVDGDQLVGIITSRDVRFEQRTGVCVRDIMTPRERLVTAKEGTDFSEIRRLLHEHRIEKVLLVDGDSKLTGMVTVKDIAKAEAFPMACKDHQGQLRVAASVGISADTDDRVAALVEAGVDLVVVDTAHGHTKGVLDRVSWIKQKYPNLDVMGGNVATADGARALIDAGADSVKVGIGPGSICTTRLVAGIGVPQLSAILSVRNGLKNKNVKIISDGGIKYSGDLAKAFAAGADAVMIGSLFAGTDETPGKLIKKNGKLFKSFRGMGSVGAMNKGSADRYFQTKQKDSSKYVAEGVEGFAKYKGDVGSIIYKLIGGLKSSMGYLGSKNILKLRNKPNFVKITKAGFYESMVHNVDVIKNDSKY